MLNAAVVRTKRFSPSLLLLTWAAINVMDVLLTYNHLRWGGLEANPLLATIGTALGPISMLAAKMTAALAIGLFLIRIGKTRQLAGAGAVMSLVVMYNAALVPVVLLG